MTCLHPSGYGTASLQRVQAIVEHGFTDRQARFLALVMRHSGVCVPRQYAQVAGIAQGAKCNAFFTRLVRRGHARAIECLHNRARLYLVHSKLLYHAIGELSSRYRRPVSPRLALERLMLLDAVLSTPAEEWLTTPAEKAAVLPLPPEMTLPDGPPIGVQADGRIVVLYLAAEPWTDAFRSFLHIRAPLLERLPQWTLRIVFPRPFGHAHDAYQAAVHEELETPLTPTMVAGLRPYFEYRTTALRTRLDAQAEARLVAGSRTFSGPRFNDLYRRWLKHGEAVFNGPSSGVIAGALESGAGRVESFVLPHSYRHLSPLVGESRSTVGGVEEGVEKGDHGGDITHLRSRPPASTPWPSRERSVVM
jgi:hypothetical protein